MYINFNYVQAHYLQCSITRLVLNLTIYLCSVGIDPANDAASLEDLYDRVYSNFVEEVDSADNGAPAKYGTSL